MIGIVAVGYRAPQESLSNVDDTGTAEAAPADSLTAEAPTVNDVVAANIAASVASAADLSVAPAVENLAVSTQVESQLAQTSNVSSISKPSIVELSSASRNIASYTVQAGDSVSSLATKFGISTDTIKWANNLTSNSLTAGQTLQILPVSGIAYTVKDGDTIQSIADKYKADGALITTYNDLDVSGIKTGLKIVIPNGVLPTDEQPGYVAPYTYAYNNAYATRYGYTDGDFTVVNPANYITVSVYANRFAAGNKNDNGQCTWYAWERRLAMGNPLPGIVLGNASSWSYTLAAAGYTVNSTPSVGAVIQNGGGAGHVGVVEAINSDGSIVISEMNNYAAGGSYVVDIRTIPAYAVGDFNYIH